MVLALIRSKLMLYGLSGLIMLSAFSYTYIKGYNDAKAKYQTASVVAELEGMKQREKISKQVMQLNRSDLDYNYAYWLRDKHESLLNDNDQPVN